MRLDRDDVRDGRAGGVRAARRERGERAQAEQDESSRAPQHAMNVGTRESARVPRTREGEPVRSADQVRGSGEPVVSSLASYRRPPAAPRSRTGSTGTASSVLPGHVQRAVLALPDVAELVRDEVVGRVGALQQDRPPERVAVVAAEAGDAEEPGRDEDADAIDPHRLGVVVERVEAGLRARRARARRGRASSALNATGASTIRGSRPAPAGSRTRRAASASCGRSTRCSSAWISPTPGVSGAVSVWSSGRSELARARRRARGRRPSPTWPSARGGRSTSVESMPSR